jgi:hypothetical protein
MLRIAQLLVMRYRSTIDDQFNTSKERSGSGPARRGSSARFPSDWQGPNDQFDNYREKFSALTTEATGLLGIGLASIRLATRKLSVC